MDREDHVAGKDAERIPDYENEEAGRAEFEHEVEDLSFGDNVHARSLSTAIRHCSRP